MEEQLANMSIGELVNLPMQLRITDDGLRMTNGIQLVNELIRQLVNFPMEIRMTN